MNVSRIFIERPVATSVLFVSILFFGWLGFRTLPVNDLPNVDFPTITVTARLPGASPEVMANTVALPLEREFSRIPGVDEMTSYSTNGNTRITLTFSLKRDIDSAAQDVQTAISQAIRRLPATWIRRRLRKLNPADAPVLMLALSGEERADAEARQVRRFAHRAAFLDRERRGAGAGVRFAEVRGAPVRRSECARQARAGAGQGGERDPGRQLQPAVRSAAGQGAYAIR